jgi:hypothetical protein
MSEKITFEKVLRVEKHGDYNNFQANDGTWYKPVTELDISAFQPGLQYKVKGFRYSDKKTVYVSSAEPVSAAAAPVAKPEAARKLPPPPTNGKSAAATPAPAVIVDAYDERRTKEAKGKTLSLFVAQLAGLLGNDPDCTASEIVDIAEGLVNEMDKRGYF